MSSATNTVDVVSADPVSWNTNTGRPMSSIQSPRSLTSVPAQSRANGRRRSGDRAAVAATRGGHPSPGSRNAWNATCTGAASAGASSRVSPMYGRSSASTAVDERRELVRARRGARRS